MKKPASKAQPWVAIPGEEFRPIPSWSNAGYQASNFGRVRQTTSTRDVILSACLNRQGYLVVYLRDGARCCIACVHVLIAESFLGARPHGLVINHRDADKLNNVPANLEYIGRGDNIRHAAALGRLRHGTNHPFCRLDEDLVRAIRVYPEGITRTARAFGVSRGVVQRIRNGQAWKHVL